MYQACRDSLVCRDLLELSVSQDSQEAGVKRVLLGEQDYMERLALPGTLVILGTL